MVGGFVQEEKVFSCQHQFCQHDASPLPAACLTDGFMDIVSLEKEQSQGVPDLCFRLLWKGIPQFVHNRIARIQTVLFLIKVTDVHPGAEAKLPGGGGQLVQQDPEQGGFPDAVGADDPYPVSLFQGK